MSWGVVLYGFLRLLLWSAVVAIALFPTLQAAPSFSSWYARDVMATVNADGHFRDLFFVIVPASAVSIATTMDYLCAARGTEIAALSAMIALMLNLVVLLSGFVGFLIIPAGKSVLGHDAFLLYSWVISGGLILSLITELWVSGATASQRQNRAASGTAKPRKR